MVILLDLVALEFESNFDDDEEDENEDEDEIVGAMLTFFLWDEDEDDFLLVPLLELDELLLLLLFVAGGFDSSLSKFTLFFVDFLRLDEDELTLSELLSKWIQYTIKLHYVDIFWNSEALEHFIQVLNS